MYLQTLVAGISILGWPMLIKAAGTDAPEKIPAHRLFIHSGKKKMAAREGQKHLKGTSSYPVKLKSGAELALPPILQKNVGKMLIEERKRLAFLKKTLRKTGGGVTGPSTLACSLQNLLDFEGEASFTLKSSAPQEALLAFRKMRIFPFKKVKIETDFLGRDIFFNLLKNPHQFLTSISMKRLGAPGAGMTAANTLPKVGSLVAPPKNLRSFDFHSLFLDPASFSWVVTHAPRLAFLKIIRPESFLEILSAAPLPSLIHLTLRDTRGNFQEAFLRQSTWPRKLKSLTLEKWEKAPLLEGVDFSALETLEISETPLTDEQLELGDVPCLTEFKASFCSLGIEGINRILGRKWASQLTVLILDSNSTHTFSQTPWAVIDTQLAKGVKHLSLSNNFLTSQGLKDFFGGQEFPCLEKLELQDNKITEEGLRFLLEKARFPKLKELNLARNSLRKKGILALIEFKDRLPEIEELKLGIVSQEVEEEVRTAFPGLRHLS